MKMHSCSKEQFEGNVREHAMTVVRDNGVDRHIRFKKPGTSCYWFDILTWPGTLCIDGDCGTFVFRRVTDMFEFFRVNDGDINPSYWAEKCVSASKRGLTEFQWETFAKNVKAYIDDEDADLQSAVLTELAFVEQDEFGAVAFIRDFEHNGFRFQDWEADSREYTFHFIWCLRAIAWAIAQWDASRKEKAA